MSEEILKALMQLFALITKQDGGISQQEIDYVNRFLVQQIGVDSSREYLQLYKDTAEDSDSAKKPGTFRFGESVSLAPINLGFWDQFFTSTPPIKTVPFIIKSLSGAPSSRLGFVLSSNPPKIVEPAY